LEKNGIFRPGRACARGCSAFSPVCFWVPSYGLQGGTQAAVKAAGSAKAADLTVLLVIPAFVVAAAMKEMGRMFV
jgi:hypothetical protein